MRDASESSQITWPPSATWQYESADTPEDFQSVAASMKKTKEKRNQTKQTNLL
jgi:hypothetical protein